MKKKIITLVFTLLHKQAFAASATTGASVGIIAALAGLSPAVWVAATFGSIYVYLHHEDSPRNRIFNIPLSIFLGVGGGDGVASYVHVTYHVDSWFLASFFALIIAMAWPWVLERFLGKKEGDK